jgi:hypothetical protein
MVACVGAPIHPGHWVFCCASTVSRPVLHWDTGVTQRLHPCICEMGACTKPAHAGVCGLSYWLCTLCGLATMTIVSMLIRLAWTGLQSFAAQAVATGLSLCPCMKRLAAARWLFCLSKLGSWSASVGAELQGDWLASLLAYFRLQPFGRAASGVPATLICCVLPGHVPRRSLYRVLRVHVYG